MAASHTVDPIRDLNNLLQRQPGGNMTDDFKWSFVKEGPEHDALYHVTAVCEHSLCNEVPPFFSTAQIYDSQGNEHRGRAWPFEEGWETNGICSSPGIPAVRW